ncbi:MAG: hypothetical protein NTV77_03270 [Candidatus Azambacteria bacterium]|nr:hypothetical protein [Candidatus Azambacteria bacterium]
MKYILNLKKISKKDIAIAGGKGASLGEMTRLRQGFGGQVQAGIPVPPGFVVSASAFDKFYGSAIPEDLAKEILAEFKKLKTKYVAVRSSATAEDSLSASWAGQLETYLNIGERDLLKSIEKCRASIDSPRARAYRLQKKLNKKKISVAVVVQKMIPSEFSGVCFTANPVTGDRSEMIIEAGRGLGEAVVGGKITPDAYIISKTKNLILDKNISIQKIKIMGIGQGTKEKSVSKNLQDKQKLGDKHILKLANICQKIETHYKAPQDIEWSFAKGKFYILQSRPITTL